MSTSSSGYEAISITTIDWRGLMGGPEDLASSMNTLEFLDGMARLFTVMEPRALYQRALSSTVSARNLRMLS